SVAEEDRAVPQAHGNLSAVALQGEGNHVRGKVLPDLRLQADKIAQAGHRFLAQLRAVALGGVQLQGLAEPVPGLRAEAVAAAPPVASAAAVAGRRFTHLYTRSPGPTGRAWIGSPPSQRRRSAARSAADW